MSRLPGRRTAALIAAPIVAAVLLTGCTATGAAGDKPAASASAVNAADETFATMMIPHHEQAVEMSETLLAKSGVDPEVAALAERVKSAQAPEIALMKGWLAAWGVDADSGMAGMHHGSMDGMMSDADMTALDDADGVTASRLYLEQMIAHHEGALAMAEAELKDGSNPAALKLAQQIVDAQKAEIAEMKTMLAAG